MEEVVDTEQRLVATLVQRGDGGVLRAAAEVRGLQPLRMQLPQRVVRVGRSLEPLFASG
jgi:hypothetical protein